MVLLAMLHSLKVPGCRKSGRRSVQGKKEQMKRAAATAELGTQCFHPLQRCPPPLTLAVSTLLYVEMWESSDKMTKRIESSARCTTAVSPMSLSSFT